MSAVLSEHPITLRQAARLVPSRRGAAHTHVAALYRWAGQGIKSVNGETIRLETARIGRDLLTSEPALRRFYARCSGETPNDGRHAVAAAALDRELI